MKNGISDTERFILLVLWAVILFVEMATGFFYSDVHPLIKLSPFKALFIYLLIRELWCKYKKRRR